MNERSIFIQAVELDDPREQEAYLRRACGEDDRLRERVEALIRSHRAAGPFVLDRDAATDLVATADVPQLTERPGSLIGPYKLLEVIGEGGMGVVHMAEQTRPVRRKVALKVIKPGMDTRQVIARFEAERQALALMDHPNIARVFDAGETPAGRPYFIMELVKGIPITEFCDQSHLTIRERLELFVSLCRAVQHAHQKGIIHRDIKPSNVLVTLHDGTPVVKVIDFGIAKAIGQQLTNKTLFTNFAQLIGTPLYMSPEQAALSGLDMDTRSDVYSLGVLLYELLTGLTPFDQERIRTAGYDELRKMILDEEPAKPSTRMSTVGPATTAASSHRKSDPKQLSQLFRGELDWIVMKALEKDRKRRYESAGAFAADVQRYLSDEQVLAYPPSTWYRVRKFARRNRVGVVMATSLVLGLLLALGGLISAVLVQSVSNTRIRQEQRQTNEALGREKTANDELKTVVAEKQQDLYFQGIALAERELDAGNVNRAEQLLDKCAPELRGWEWHYLKRSSRSPVAPLQHDATVLRVAISRSGELLASGDIEGGIHLWDARTYRPLRHIPAHKSMVRGLAFDHDGKRLASASDDGTKIWSVPDGKRLQDLPGDGRGVHCVCFNPAGRLACLGESELTVWDVATWRRLLSIPSVGGFEVTFDAGGRRLAGVHQERDVGLWDAVTGELIRTLTGPGSEPWCVAFSPDGRLLAAGTGEHGTQRSGEIWVWDTETGRELYTLRGHVYMLFGLSFSPDGRRLASAGFDQVIKVWDAEAGREALNLRGHKNGIGSLAFAADGRLFSASDDRTIRVWDGRDWHEGEGGQELLSLPGHDEGVNSIAFSRHGSLFASADSRGVVKIRSSPALGRGRVSEDRTLQTNESTVLAIAFSPDGEHLAAAAGNSVRIWQAATGKDIRDLHPEKEGLFKCVAFSPDGRHLAAGGAREDGAVSIWDLRTGLRTHQPLGRDSLNAVAFHPSDGRYLVTAGERGVVRVWDWAAEKEMCDLLPQQEGRITGLAFSPDGRRLACCGWDRTVRVWEIASPDPRTWRQRRPISNPSGAVECVAFSHDGRYLAWGGTDSTLKVCALAVAATGGSPTIRTCYGHTSWVRAVAFSPDGRHIATGSRDGSLKVWAVPFD